jgi:hypothetical protein
LYSLLNEPDQPALTFDVHELIGINASRPWPVDSHVFQIGQKVLSLLRSKAGISEPVYLVLMLRIEAKPVQIVHSLPLR